MLARIPYPTLNLSVAALQRGLPLLLSVLTLCTASAPLFADHHEGSEGTVAEVEVNVSDRVVFAGGNEAPWRLYLGSANNWMVPVQGPETTAFKSKVVLVRELEDETAGNIVQAEWRGGLGQVYWQEDKPWDFSALAAKGGAVSMVLRVDQRPRKSVDVKMDCGYPCAGTLNMTQLFKAVPEGQWFRVSLGLDCFKEAGANLEHIVSPVVIATTGDFTLSFADVRLLTDPPAESVVACN